MGRLNTIFQKNICEFGADSYGFKKIGLSRFNPLFVELAQPDFAKDSFLTILGSLLQESSFSREMSLHTHTRTHMHTFAHTHTHILTHTHTHTHTLQVYVSVFMCTPDSPDA